MKILAAALLVLLAFFSHTLTKVARINQHISAAHSAYLQKDFNTAIFLYTYLNDSMQVRDRAVRLNLAHAYFLNQNPSKAYQYYQPLLKKSPTTMASVVNVQLGILTASENKPQALDFFKKAIILNPGNQEARYNYELLKKYLALHPEENNQALPPTQAPEPKNKKETETAGNKENPEGNDEANTPDFENTNPENSPEPGPGKSSNSNNPESEINRVPDLNPEKPVSQKNKNINTGTLPGTERGTTNKEGNFDNNNKNQGGRDEMDSQDKTSQTTYERLREANISPEKARMLLEAMREAEAQYLQQVPRKSNRNPDKNKPNW